MSRMHTQKLLHALRFHCLGLDRLRSSPEKCEVVEPDAKPHHMVLILVDVDHVPQQGK